MAWLEMLYYNSSIGRNERVQGIWTPFIPSQPAPRAVLGDGRCRKCGIYDGARWQKSHLRRLIDGENLIEEQVKGCLDNTGPDGRSFRQLVMNGVGTSRRR